MNRHRQTGMAAEQRLEGRRKLDVRAQPFVRRMAAGFMVVGDVTICPRDAWAKPSLTVEVVEAGRHGLGWLSRSALAGETRPVRRCRALWLMIRSGDIVREVENVP
jgi:hypothetical protein